MIYTVLYHTFSFYKKMSSSSRSEEHDNEDYEHFSEYSSDFWCWYRIFSCIMYLYAISVLLALYYKRMFWKQKFWKQMFEVKINKAKYHIVSKIVFSMFSYFSIVFCFTMLWFEIICFVLTFIILFWFSMICQDFRVYFNTQMSSS